MAGWGIFVITVDLSLLFSLFSWLYFFVLIMFPELPCGDCMKQEEDEVGWGTDLFTKLSNSDNKCLYLVFLSS